MGNEMLFVAPLVAAVYFSRSSVFSVFNWFLACQLVLLLFSRTAPDLLTTIVLATSCFRC